MPELELELDLGGAVRRALIKGLADMVDAIPQYRYAVILELLKRDSLSRTMIAEAMGEAALREKKHDDEQQALLDSTDFQQGDVRDLTWDEIMLEELAIMQDTPSGRGEV